MGSPRSPPGRRLDYILSKGLTCIFCIGECLPIRQKGIDTVLAECADELRDIVPILKKLEDKSRVVIAYEPRSTAPRSLPALQAPQKCQKRQT